MCNHKILAHSSNGYIIRHEKCNHIQIAFGTTLITFSTNEYEEFVSLTAQLFQLYRNDGFPQQKNISIEIFSNHVQMVLCFNELIKLIELIEEANVILEIEHILQSTDKNTQQYYKN